MSNFTLAPEQEKTLQKVSSTIAEESAVVMSTLLDKKIDIVVQKVGAVDSEALSSEFPESIVVVDCAFASGYEGNNYFLLNKPLVAKLSDLMMMGDGTAEFSEDHIDAIQEAINQMMGAAATALSTLVNKSVDFSPSQAKESTLEDAGLGLDDMTVQEFELQIEGEPQGKFSLLISFPVIQEFAESLGKGAAESRTQAEVSPELEMPMGEETAAAVPSFGEEPGEPPRAAPSGASLVQFLSPTELNNMEKARLELLLDIKLDVSIELGRTEMLVRDILELGAGSIVELNKMAGETVDLLINNKKLAEGEVVVVDENFGVRITHLVSMEERIKMLQAI